MPTSISQIALSRPAEMEIVGRLVVTYGELEFLLADCVSAALGDQDQGFRIVYRTRGEEQRILVASAAAMPRSTALNLNHRFAQAISDMRYCRKIRNQYAHSHWYPPNASYAKGRLCFVDLEDPAKKNTKLSPDLRPVTLVLLQEQDAYFTHVSDRLELLGRGLADPASIPSFQWPKEMQRPLRYSSEKTKQSAKAEDSAEAARTND